MKTNFIAHNKDSDEIYMACLRAERNGRFAVISKWCREGRDFVSGFGKICTRPEEALAEAYRLFKKRTESGYVDIESQEYNGHLKMTDKIIVDNLEENGDGEKVIDESLSILTNQRWVISSPDQEKRFITGPATIRLKSGEEASKASCECGSDVFDKVKDENDKRMFKCAKCNKVWGLNGRSVKNKYYEDDVVKCIDNTGIEDKFDKGIEYVCEMHDDINMIYVYDKFGQKQECFRDRFYQPSPFKHMDVSGSMSDVSDSNINPNAIPSESQKVCESCQHFGGCVIESCEYFRR